MSAKPATAEPTEAPLGAHKRDRIIAGKALYWLAGLFAVSVQAVIVYAGNAYLESRANEAVSAQLTPIVKKTAEEFEKRLLVSTYAADMRTSAVREGDVNRRVGDLEQLTRANRALIDQQKDQFHRLELLLREGFAKQGVTISQNPR